MKVYKTLSIDPELARQLEQEENQSRFVCDLLREHYEGEGLTSPERSAVESFIEECVEQEPGAWVPKERVRQRYRWYTEDFDLPHAEPHVFGRYLLQSNQVRTETSRRRVDGELTQGYADIRVEDRWHWPDE